MHPSVRTHPFPHVVIDADLDLEMMAHNARVEFDAVPPSAWHWFDNENEGKAQAPFSVGGRYIQKLAAGFAAPEWIKTVEGMFGIPGLMFDELGGGLHRIKPGGRLGVHVDFNRHPDGRHRRINLLMFLNRRPDPSADLMLCTDPPRFDADPLRIAPTMGRVVMFVTSETSWHGHPLRLQGDEERRSLAAYYYTDEPPDNAAEPHDTVFV